MHYQEVSRRYHEEYRELALSELLLALMEEDENSVRELAKEAGISANAIQHIRSGQSSLGTSLVSLRSEVMVWNLKKRAPDSSEAASAANIIKVISSSICMYTKIKRVLRAMPSS